MIQYSKAFDMEDGSFSVLYNCKTDKCIIRSNKKLQYMCVSVCMQYIVILTHQHIAILNILM